MNIEIIKDLFDYCFNNGSVPNKVNKKDSWDQLLFFMNTRSEVTLDGIFRGDSVAMQKFIITCYDQNLLPVQVFGPLLRNFTLRNGGGSIYLNNIALLLEMLHYAGLDNMLLKYEKEHFKTLPNKITIYRGGNFSDNRFIFYSMKRKISEVFISYALNTHHLISGTLNKSDILIMKGLGDYIICDSDNIINRKIIAFKNANDVLIEVKPISEIATL